MSTVLEVTTASRVMTVDHLPPPEFPVVRINGRVLPPPPPVFAPTGYRVLVLDDTNDPTDPSAVLSDGYVPLSPDAGHLWVGTYQYLSDGVVRQVLGSGNPDAQLLVVATFGLDRQMPPTNEAFSLFLNYGAGPFPCKNVVRRKSLGERGLRTHESRAVVIGCRA